MFPSSLILAPHRLRWTRALPYDQRCAHAAVVVLVRIVGQLIFVNRVCGHRAGSNTNSSNGRNFDSASVNKYKTETATHSASKCATPLQSTWYITLGGALIAYESIRPVGVLQAYLFVGTVKRITSPMRKQLHLRVP